MVKAKATEQINLPCLQCSSSFQTRLELQREMGKKRVGADGRVVPFLVTMWKENVCFPLEVLRKVEGMEKKGSTL